MQKEVSMGEHLVLHLAKSAAGSDLSDADALQRSSMGCSDCCEFAALHAVQFCKIHGITLIFKYDHPLHFKALRIAYHR